MDFKEREMKKIIVVLAVAFLIFACDIDVYYHL